MKRNLSLEEKKFAQSRFNKTTALCERCPAPATVTTPVQMENETDSAPRPSEIALSDTILIKVGSEGKKYTLHKDLLTHYSGFFKGALSGNFKETDDGVVPLDDIQTDAFDVFVDWVYEKKVPNHVSYEASNDDVVPVRYHAYVLADRLLAPGFKNALLETFLDVFVDEHRPPMYHAITFAFNNLVAEDPLLRLLVDAFVINHSIGYYRGRNEPVHHIQDMPQEVLARLFARMHEVQSRDGSEAEQKTRLRREDYKIST